MSKTSPWAETLELWWQTLVTSIPETDQPLFRKFLDQGQSYFRLNEEFMRVFQDLFTSNPVKDNETLLWEQGFETLRKNFNDLLKSNQTIGLWELPLENWLQTMALLTHLKLDNLETGVFNSTLFRYEKFLQLFFVPYANLTQRGQRILERRTQLWRDYQQAQEEYTAMFNKISLHTIELLRDKITALRQQGKKITQLRAVYDLWVDCGEEAYAQFAGTDEYSKINARLINSWMAWRRYEFQQIDEILAILNVPTRQEMDKMSYRLQQLGRKLKTQSNEVNETLLTELYKEINTLKSAVTQLQQNTKPTTPPRRSTRKKIISQPITESLSPHLNPTNRNDDPPNGGK